MPDRLASLLLPFSGLSPPDVEVSCLIFWQKVYLENVWTSSICIIVRCDQINQPEDQYVGDTRWKWFYFCPISPKVAVVFTLFSLSYLLCHLSPASQISLSLLITRVCSSWKKNTFSVQSQIQSFHLSHPPCISSLPLMWNSKCSPRSFSTALAHVGNSL